MKLLAFIFEQPSYLLRRLTYTSERTCNGLAVFWPTMDLAESGYMVV